MTGGMRSGQLTAATGIGRETLRYYERRGLLAPARRTPGGTREYPPDAVRRLHAIRTAKRLGFSLAEIERLVRSAGRHPASSGWHAAAHAKLAELDRRIVEITVARQQLAAAIDAGCADLEHCVGSPRCPVDLVGSSTSG